MDPWGVRSPISDELGFVVTLSGSVRKPVCLCICICYTNPISLRPTVYRSTSRLLVRYFQNDMLFVILIAIFVSNQQYCLLD